MQKTIDIPRGPHFHRESKLCDIPKLFRWLVDLYPVVLESVNEGFNSKAMKIDNFYLDMNGIIHTCTHSNNDKLIVLNEKEMFQRIFAYTDRLYKLVKPGRLMFLAVDGVAPRAKMYIIVLTSKINYIFFYSMYFVCKMYTIDKIDVNIKN